MRERLLADGSLYPVAVGPGEGAALRGWVSRERARHSLEVGLGYGVSTLFICEGLLENGDDVAHLAVDPYQFERLPHHRTVFGGAGVAALQEAGVREIVELIVERSETALPRLLSEHRRFDLAFVDGNHRFEGVFVDLFFCGRLVPRGVVFVDDAQLPAVRRAAAFFVANLGWAVIDEGSEGEHEWLVLRTGAADAFDRPFREFTDF